MLASVPRSLARTCASEALFSSAPMAETLPLCAKQSCRKPPAGAVLVDGRWQLTELSAQIAADRLLREREQRRNRRREMRKLLRQSHPDLFVFARKQDPQQTTLTPEVRLKERQEDT